MSIGHEGRRRGLAVLLAVALALIAAPPAGAATITVTNNGDDLLPNAGDGDCTLREAVQATNLNADQDQCDHDGGTGADTINLATNTTYVLTGGSFDDANNTGDLDVETAGTTDGPLTIQGGGPGTTTIDANDLDRVIDVRANGNLTLNDVVITDGDAKVGDPNGGGVISRSGGILSVIDSTITQNNSAGTGGGIEAAGTNVNQTAAVTITDSVVSDNTAAGNFGGGGISSQAAVTVTGSTISGNDATSSGPTAGGGGINASIVSVTDSEIDGNTTNDGNGGGLISSTGTVTVTNSSITDNDAGDGSGGGIDKASGTITLSDTLVDGNDAAANGGGIRNQAGTTLTIDSSVVSNNDTNSSSTLSGAGIINSGTLTMTGSVLAGNTGTTGAAVANLGAGLFNQTNSSATLIRTTVEANDLAGGTQQGAGIRHSGGTGALTLVNSTVSGNSAPAGGALGGGIYTTGGTVNLAHATVSANTAATGDGIYHDVSPVNLRNSVFNDGCSGDFGGIVSGGNNVAVDGSCVGNTNGDLPNATLDLAALADNGGPDAGSDTLNTNPVAVKTHALGPLSQAVDKVPNASCTDGASPTPNAITVDQRGVARPFGPACDAGSYERATCFGQAATIVGTPGDDTNASIGIPNTNVNDVIMTFGGNDNVNGVDGIDRICGGNGDDSLEGGGGSDVDFLDGESGSDTYSMVSVTGSHTATLGAPGSATGDNVTSDELHNFENLEGSVGGDSLNGDEGPNLIFGGGSPALGADVLEGRGGDDTLDGEGGSDIVGYFNAPSGVTVSLATVGQQNTGGAGTDTILSAERLTGSNFNDQLTGSLVTNTIIGLDGDDVINPGPDNVPDQVIGSNGSDTVSYADGTNGVDANTDTNVATGHGTDAIDDIENVIGGPFGDTLTGDSGPNVLNGASESDLVDGAGGADDITGGPSFDNLSGGAGPDDLFARDGEADTVDCGTEADTIETDAQGVDTIVGCEQISFPAIPPVLPPPVGRCAGKAATITGTNAADVLNGTPGADVIAALGGNDVVNGLAGNDLLCGGAGADRLKGGAGKDRLFGDAGRDSLNGGAGRGDRCNGGAGRDRRRAKGCERRRKLP